MSKAIIVTDFAYKGPKRMGRGTGRQGLRATLKYLQYRDKPNNHLAQSKGYERWQDRGLGGITATSSRGLAWTWVISPAPDLMELVPENQRRTLMYELTNRVVEDYYTERGLDVPEYSFVMHCARTKAKYGEPARDHLHTHVILPGTVPSTADRLPVYNNATKGHDRLFREIASRHFAEALDLRIGQEWRRLREIPAPERDADGQIDLDAYFSR
ncbi:MAG: hypothetical protein IPK52_26005 [Chloroflexi bacterium]|nr:hypothetical protein [Chloroflexota bacterium]